MELFLVLKPYAPLILAVAVLLWEGWVQETRIERRVTRLENQYHRGGPGGGPLSRVRESAVERIPGPTVEIGDLGNV